MSNIYSFDCYMNYYRDFFSALIREKKGVDSNTLEKKIEKAYQQAKDIFSIEGDSQFQETIHNLLKKICEVKPGRKLMKILSKNLEKKLRIINGENGNMCQFDRDERIFLKPSESFYYALKNNTVVITTRPPEITLAHEIIHAVHQYTEVNLSEAHGANDMLHARETGTQVDSLFTAKHLVSNDMTTFFEQKTIIGFDFYSVRIRTTMNKYDVLCENAFLLSRNLLPRINHRSADGSEEGVDVNNTGNGEDTLEDYFQWMDREFRSISEFQEDKKGDEEFILKFIERHPIAITSISDHLKTEKFLLKALAVDIHIISHFPELKSNEDFIRKAMLVDSRACYFASSDLLNKEEFMIYALKNVCKTRLVDLYKRVKSETRNELHALALQIYLQRRVNRM